MLTIVLRGVAECDFLSFHFWLIFNVALSSTRCLMAPSSSHGTPDPVCVWLGEFLCFWICGGSALTIISTTEVTQHTTHNTAKQKTWLRKRWLWMQARGRLWLPSSQVVSATIWMKTNTMTIRSDQCRGTNCSGLGQFVSFICVRNSCNTRWIVWHSPPNFYTDKTNEILVAKLWRAKDLVLQSKFNTFDHQSFCLLDVSSI